MKFNYFANKRPSDPYLKKRARRRLLGLASLAALALLAVFAFVLVGKNLASSKQDKPKRSEILALWEQNDYASLNDACDKVLLLNPLDSYALLFKGFAAFYSGLANPDAEQRQTAMDASVTHIRKALTDPNCPLVPQARYVLGKAYYAKGLDYWDICITELDAASELGYSPDDSWEYRALASYGSGQIARSLGYFTESLARFPDSPELSLAASRAWADSGDWAKAESLAKAAKAATSDEYLLERADFLIAEACVAGQRLAEAREHYSFIIQRNPESADAWYQDGLVLAKQGDLIAARAAWRKAVSIDPMHALARQKLAERS